MQLSDLQHSKLLSPELFNHIMTYFNPVFVAQVRMIELHHAIVVPMPTERNWNQFAGDDILPGVNFETRRIEIQSFGSNYGERIKAGYDTENHVLYIDVLTPFSPQIIDNPYNRPIKPMEHKPLIWHKNPDESIWVYGDRMFKTRGDSAYIDNPRKRKEYQKAVFKVIVNIVMRKG